MLFLALACTGWFGSSSADSADTSASTETGDTDDTGDTDNTPTDDSRVRALTNLPEGDYPCLPPELVRVAYITDGDTVYVHPEDGSGGFKVRMIGIDTPEIEHEDPAECYGNEAMAFTSQELEGKLAWLTYDAECLDYYDRHLAYVIRGEGEEGFHNRALARQGYASELSIEPNDTYESQFRSDVAAAKSEGLGMWGNCGD